MAKSILAYMPTYSPDAGVEDGCGRPLIRLSNEQIANRINTLGNKSRARPFIYMDCIDSVVNTRPDVDLVVADARSSDIVREGLSAHHKQSGGYQLAFYPGKMSQWALFNDILARHATDDTKYVVYTSSDIIWCMDWVEECIREFDKDPSLQILFPTVNSGDVAIPIQLAPGPKDIDLVDPADHMECLGMAAAKAPCLNMYAAIFRMDFLKAYGGYMTAFRNCFTESFLYFQSEAMGGKMRLCPRAWCYHHNGVDVWVGEGGFYHYSAEKPKFDRMMREVQAMRAAGKCDVPFLREILYKEAQA